MENVDLLSLLSDGKFHSGQELGRRLGVSRSAVWKALGRLSEMSFPLETVKGKGYRIKGGIELLQEQSVRSDVPSDTNDMFDLVCLFKTASTNQYVVADMDKAQRPYFIAIAERQTEGRGRRGRNWVSPVAQNIYMSIGFNINGGVDALEGLSLVVGIAIANMISGLGVEGAGIKWPNDIWIDGEKVAGILIELQGEATSGWRVVVGVGLNHLMSEQDGQLIDQPWCRLGDYSNIGRNALVGHLIEALVMSIERFKREGFDSFRSEWEEFDKLYGRSVSIDDGRAGRAHGVDASGALLLDTGNGQIRISAGEVSVRPNES